MVIAALLITTTMMSGEALASDVGTITVATNADGRLELFRVGGVLEDGVLYHKGQTSAGGGWSGSASLGGGSLQPRAPAVISGAGGALAVSIVRVVAR